MEHHSDDDALLQDLGFFDLDMNLDSQLENDGEGKVPIPYLIEFVGTVKRSGVRLLSKTLGWRLLKLKLIL